MRRYIYNFASVLAVFLIAIFMLATITAELNGNRNFILIVKTDILLTLPILILSIILTGILGRLIPGGNIDVIRRKRRRLTIIAPIGLFILIPCAITLRALAAAHNFGIFFATLQGLELIGGAINLTLLSLNARERQAHTIGHLNKKSLIASTGQDERKNRTPHL